MYSCMCVCVCVSVCVCVCVSVCVSKGIGEEVKGHFFSSVSHCVLSLFFSPLSLFPCSVRFSPFFALRRLHCTATHSRLSITTGEPLALLYSWSLLTSSTVSFPRCFSFCPSRVVFSQPFFRSLFRSASVYNWREAVYRA